MTAVSLPSSYHVTKSISFMNLHITLMFGILHWHMYTVCTRAISDINQWHIYIYIYIYLHIYVYK